VGSSPIASTKVPGQIVYDLGLFASPAASVSNDVSNATDLLRTRMDEHGR
jgi:hypothetical protein